MAHKFENFYINVTPENVADVENKLKLLGYEAEYNKVRMPVQVAAYTSGIYDVYGSKVAIRGEKIITVEQLLEL